jgi:transposase
VPAEARLCLQMLAAQLAVVKEQILENDRRVRTSARQTELGRRSLIAPSLSSLLSPLISLAPGSRFSSRSV